MVSFACNIPFRNYVIGYVWLKIYVHNLFLPHIQRVSFLLVFSRFKIPNMEKTPVFHLIKLTVNFIYLTVVAVVVVVIVIRRRINCKVINRRHARLTVLGGSRIAGNQ